MDLRDLRYFLKVAEFGHLGRAAEALNLSQPALSKCIQRLEDAYGVALFDRAGRGIVLTEAGKLLQERYQLLAHDLEDIRIQVSSFRKGIAGTVRVGCSASIAQFFLPGVCRTLREKAPDLRLLIRTAMDDALEDALKAGSIDIIIRPGRPAEADDWIVSTPLLSDTVVVVAGKGHPLVDQEPSLEAMSKFSWVLPTPAVSTRQWLEHVFLAAGLPAPDAAVTATPLVAAPFILEETDLLSFMSRRNLAASTGIVELENTATTLHRQFDIVHRSRSFLSPAVRYFLNVVHQEVVLEELTPNVGD